MSTACGTAGTRAGTRTASRSKTTEREWHDKWHGRQQGWYENGQLKYDSWYEHDVLWDRKAARQEVAAQGDLDDSGLGRTSGELHLAAGVIFELA